MPPKMIYELAKLGDARKFDDAFEKESIIINEIYSSSKDMIGSPVLFLALEGHFDGVEILLARGASLFDAVFGAALGGHNDAVWRYINEKGASVESAANGATQGGHFELLKSLVTYVGHNSLSMFSHVYCLAVGGHQDVVFSLIKENEEFVQSAANGAAIGGHFEMLSKLETYTAVSLNSSEILFYLAKGGHEDIVWHYINEKAAVIQRAAQGAAIAGHYELLKKLEAFAADSLDVSDIVCHLAAGGHESAVMQYIMEKGASAKFAALGAASRGQLQLLDKLESNADFSIDLMDIVYQLSLSGHDDAVLRYIKEKGISAQQAAECASLSGQLTLLRKIEAQEGFSLTLSEIVGNFAVGGHEEAVLCYAREKGISLRQVAVCAAQNGQLKLLNLIETQGDAPLSTKEIIHYLLVGGHEEIVLSYINEKNTFAQDAAEIAIIHGYCGLLSKLEEHFGDLLNQSDIAFQLAANGYEDQVLRYIKEKGASAEWAAEGAMVGGHLALSSKLTTLARLSQTASARKALRDVKPLDISGKPEDAEKLRNELLAEEEESNKNKRQSKSKSVTITKDKSRDQDPWEKYWKKLVQLDSISLSEDFVARYAVLQVEARDKNASHRFFATPRKTEGFSEPLTPLFLVVYHYFRLAIAANRNSVKMREKLLADLSQMIEVADQTSCYGMVNVTKASSGIKQSYSVVFLLLDMMTFYHHKVAPSLKKHTLRMLEVMPEAVWQQQFFAPGGSDRPLDSPLRMITALFRSNIHSADFATAAVHIAVARAPLAAWIECPPLNADSGWRCSPLAILLDALCNRIMSRQQDTVEMSGALIKTLRNRGVLDPEHSAIMALTFAYRNESSEMVQCCSVQQMLADIDDMLNDLSTAPRATA